jgi:hypothetical protein
MALQEGPEADGRHPKINGLPGFDCEFLLKLYTDPDRAMFLGNIGSRTTVTEDTILVDNFVPLGNVHKQKQPCRNLQVHAREGFLRGQVSPNRIGSERGQGLMSAEEDFVGGSTEDRQREENNQPQR